MPRLTHKEYGSVELTDQRMISDLIGRGYTVQKARTKAVREADEAREAQAPDNTPEQDGAGSKKSTSSK